MTREKAIKILSSYKNSYFGDALHGGVISVSEIIELLSAQPEWKKGKWTIEDCHASTYPYCCSNCTAHHRARYDFCPTCGADMRERREK